MKDPSSLVLRVDKSVDVEVVLIGTLAARSQTSARRRPNEFTRCSLAMERAPLGLSALRQLRSPPPEPPPEYSSLKPRFYNSLEFSVLCHAVPGERVLGLVD
jgi:hypothetical protein